VKSRWSLRWWNPYTTPPAGLEHFYAEEITDGRERPLNLERMCAPGDGWAICWSPLHETPPRQLSLETKQRIRRKALSRRAAAKVPLFADSFIAERLAAQPDYFGVVEVQHA